MFGSYEEMRDKYSSLLEEFRLKCEREIESKEKEMKLRIEAQQYEIRIDELLVQITRLKDVIKEREKDIAIKRQ